MSGKSLFDKQKSDCFSKLDLSRKGSIDEPILDIIQTLNNHQDFFSLSSCSGRIVVLREGGKGERSEPADNKGTSIVKEGCAWIHVAHEAVDADQVSQLVLQHQDAGVEGCIVIKFEPLVLHIQCRNTEAAKLLHTVALEAGFRNSGITLGKSGKVVSAVRSTHGLEVPISNDQGEILVSSDYIKFVLKKANLKLEENQRRISKFEQKLNFYLSNYKKSDDSVKPKKFSKKKCNDVNDRDKHKEARIKEEKVEVDDIDLDVLSLQFEEN